MAELSQYWRDGLEGLKPSVNINEPQPGFYKLRRAKDGPWLPVAIWLGSDGELLCRVGPDREDPHEIWSWCAGNCVSIGDARHAFENGSWPGDAPFPASHNSPPEEEEKSLSQKITYCATSALDWLKKSGIKDQTTSDIAANYRAELNSLKKQADAERVAEKKPHLDASRDVDKRWKPFIEEADGVAKKLRDALSEYMRNEEAKARAEAVAKQRAEEERLKKVREEELKHAPLDSVLEPAPPPPKVEPRKVTSGGQYGRKTALRTQVVYQITDYEAALAHAKNHPDVVAAVLKVVRAQAKSGATVPGVTKKEERVAA